LTREEEIVNRNRSETKKRSGKSENSDDPFIHKKVLVLLKEMRIFVCDVLGNETYLRNSTFIGDRLLNRGHMSLISQKYFNFATQLMQLVRKHTSEKLLLKEQCDYIKNGKALIANDSKGSHTLALYDFYLFNAVSIQ
jgi:hypothetical protein